MRNGIAFILAGVLVFSRLLPNWTNSEWYLVINIIGAVMIVILIKPEKDMDKNRFLLIMGGLFFCLGGYYLIYQIIETDVADLVISIFSILIGIVLIIRSKIISRQK